MKLAITMLATLALLSCKDDRLQANNNTQVITEEPSDVETVKRAEIIAFAKEQLGTKYCYAGSEPETGFDCSGFVNYVFQKFDIELPRSSSGFEDVGPALDPKDFKVGDILVFYGYQDRDRIGHVGIISEADGMNSKFIHSSSGKEMAVMISELGSDAYTKRFYKAVDVISEK
jgi:cell wall-associated NlpC family hydrolase